MSRLPPVPVRPPKRASPAELKAAIRDRALALGFDAVGFAPATDDAREIERRRAALADFLAAGHHGDMGWLGDRTEARTDPTRLWREARTVVSVGLSYAPATDPLAAAPPATHGDISVYARGRDYHDVLKTRLKALGRFIWDSYRRDLKVFVDTAPLMEKPLAQRAGLGWQGKHTNLVSRGHGSWLFLGELLISADLPADEPETDRCGQCRACLDACPTAAFPAPYRLDARRCISYLTIEHEGAIARELRPLLGNRIYGCDVCLAVCPWNKFAEAARETALHARPALDGPALADLARLDEAGFRKRFAGTAVKRIGRDRFLRNVAYALGNAPRGDATIAAVEALIDDDAPLVRAAAIWSLSRLAPARCKALRSARLASETDYAVCEEWRATAEEEAA